MMKGDMVETIQSTNQPVFVATGNFPGTKGYSKKGQALPVSDITSPAICSYAFKNGKENGIILINMDLEKKHDIKLNFKGKVKKGSVSSKLVAPDNYLDNNEFESGKPNIKIEKIKLDKFANGSIISLKPSSCQIISWKEDGKK